MQEETAIQRETAAGYTALKLPIMLGSLTMTMLPFLLPLYAKQLGASAIGIGGLFAIAQCMILLLRPLIGWSMDRHGYKGFFVAGVAGYTGAMAVLALANNLTMLYLAQLLYGLATACTWTAIYTMTAALATPAEQGHALGRVDEYSHRGALYGTGLALILLNGLALHPALRLLFMSYAALAAVGLWLAWKQTPATRAAATARVGQQPLAWWPLARVLLIILLSYLFTSMLRPVFVVFLQDDFTKDVRLLVLAFLPATLLESFLPSRLGRLSDRWGRRPLITAGLAWIGLCCVLIPLRSQLPWVIVWWTLKTLGLTAALPPQKALISDLTQGTQRGTGYGLYTFATSLGAAVGPLLGGWLYEVTGHSIPFFLTGIALLTSLGWGALLLHRR
jgi:MFS family permease